ncbi:hypothetical protein GCM10009830_44320 [Glycomyces endophyticus]|uniref:Hsp70 family protein n=1 Tax=Glycomyces endophyticus TaxID=480996 RepID=A0ABN2HQA2_9ACTN
MNAPVWLAVDLGTTHTVAVIGRGGQEPRSLLFDGSPLLASGVYLDADGALHTGRDAQRLAAADPGRFEPHPKRRIDDGTVLLGDRELPVEEVLATGLRRVAEEAAASGMRPTDIVLTYPADWGPVRRARLEAAAELAGMGRVRLLPEPIAAAAYCAEVLGQEIPRGGTVAIFDFGGGTFDVAVVRRDDQGRLRTLAFGGLDDLGGLDIDMALASHLGRVVAGRDPALWKRLSEPETTADLRDRLAFWGEVRAAKEMLSRTSTAPVGLPGHNPMGLHLTRDELTSLADPLVARAVDETRRTVERAGVEPASLAALLLVGGSSRMPLVATRLHARLGVTPSVPEQPELPVAFGALQHATAEPETAPPPATTPMTPLTYAPYPVQSPAGSLPPQQHAPQPSPQFGPSQPPHTSQPSPPYGPSQPTPAGPYPPPAAPGTGFQPNVHTGPLPGSGPAPKRWIALSVVSSIAMAIVILIVVAVNSIQLDSLFGDFSGGDLVEGLSDLGGGDGATDGTDLQVVKEQALTTPGAAAVAAGDGVAVITDVVDGKLLANAYDAAGTALWTNEYELEPTETFLTITGNLLLIDAMGSAVDEGQNMRAAVALDTGEFLWKQPWIDRNDLAFYGTDVLVEQRTGIYDNAVVRIDLTTGEEVWKKGGPDGLFLIDEYRIRAETVWNDGGEYAGAVPPNSYALYDNLAVANRVVDLEPYEGTAVVRDAADGGSITSGDLPLDSHQWTAFDGLAVGKLSEAASPGRAVLAGFALDGLAEAWRVEFAAGDAIVNVKPCGQHLVCAAVENSSAETYQTVAVDTQSGTAAWELDSIDWAVEEQWYTSPTGIVHGDQTFDTVSAARVVDFDGTVVQGGEEPYSSVLAVRGGRAVVEQVGYDGTNTAWEVYVLDLATGDRTPVHNTGVELYEHVAISGDLVAVHAGDGRALLLAASGLG